MHPTLGEKKIQNTKTYRIYLCFRNGAGPWRLLREQSGGERATSGSWLFPSTMWVQGTEFKIMDSLGDRSLYTLSHPAIPSSFQTVRQALSHSGVPTGAVRPAGAAGSNPFILKVLLTVALLAAGRYVLRWVVLLAVGSPASKGLRNSPCVQKAYEKLFSTQQGSESQLVQFPGKERELDWIRIET